MTGANYERARLAINGGKPAREAPWPPMYPGGMAIDAEEEQSVLETLHTRRLFRYYGPQPGPSKVQQFEQAFATHLGVPYSVAVNSGTSALICGLQSIGVGPGDEVIVPAYTWIASAAAVLAVGAVPVAAEVDESLTLDPASVEVNITPATRAIMAVHMRGAPCRMAELSAIAERHHLALIEDTAQAVGASYQGRRLGTIGQVGCFSFQFNKIITGGEGGMVTTHDEGRWQRAIMYHDVIGGLRNHFPDDLILWGINFRMPELVAAVMLPQLKRLDGLLEAMRARKRILKEGLAETLARKGLTFRDISDPQGDAAIALVFFARDSASAAEIAQALEAENIPAYPLYHPSEVDYHVCVHWTPIVHQRTWTPNGGPWRWTPRPVSYGPEVCPRSLDLLGRAVHLDISPLLTNRDLEETLEGLNRVINVLG